MPVPRGSRRAGIGLGGMGDFVGVDPQRVAKAATALEHLRDVLAANGPTIIRIVGEYGADINLAPLRKALGQSVTDAADMRARAQLAAKAAAQLPLFDAPGTMVTIPWDHADVDVAAAQADARSLAQAEKNTDSAAARAEIISIEADIKDHLNDPAYLKVFYHQAAAQVAALATTLHGQDGNGLTVLSAQDQQTLNTYARGLAAVDKSGGLSTTTVKTLTNAKGEDLWSVGMLFKFGPPGSAYGTQEGNGKQNLVARVTQSIEMARMHGGYTIPFNWRGAEGQNLAPGRIARVLSEFDPSQSMLTVATQNGAAAREVMADPDGKQIAADLMKEPVTLYRPVRTDGGRLIRGYSATALANSYIDGQPAPVGGRSTFQGMYGIIPAQAIGTFFDTATAAPRGSDSAAYDSAWAAVNIIDGTPPPTGANGAAVPEPVRHALMNTFARYMPDLAASTEAARDPVHPPPGAQEPYVIGIGGAQLSSFLQQISANKNDFATIHGMAGLAMGTSTGLQSRGITPPGLVDPVQGFASLYGRIGTEASNVGISKAEQKDLRDQELNTMIAMTRAGFGAIPGGQALTAAQKLAAVTAPGIPQFSTDNAAKATAAANTQAGRDQLLAEVPLVRGLQQTGALPDPPPPDAFDSNGNPTTKFGDWWTDTGAGEKVAGKPLADWLTPIQVAMGVQDTAYGG